MTVREILREIVTIRQRRFDRVQPLLPRVVSPDESDMLLIDLLEAKLALAREPYTPVCGSTENLEAGRELCGELNPESKWKEKA